MRINKFIQSIQWKKDQLILLDQTRLPEEMVFLSLSTIKEVWEAIRYLKVRGAPAIGMAAAYGLYLGVQKSQEKSVNAFITELEQKSEYLATARPTAVNLFWALNRLKGRACQGQKKGLNVDFIKRNLLEEALNIQEEDESVCRQIGEHALSLFKDGMGILTHCNAGSLATALYGTATAPFYIAKEQGWNLKIFVNETRPVLQGARLTTWELQKAGIDVTLICDSMAAVVMANQSVQAVIVGTDRVAANGDVANKIGTYTVALLAKAHGIPFYVAAPLSSVDLSTPTGKNIQIEERSEAEITVGLGKRIAPQGIKVYNPAFDITPYSLVTAFVTEKGIVYPDAEGQYDSILRNL
ncbi:S-methyl-5-thioribose-1-phosphate isomerase [Peribacillus simplex]|uniref:S-methyl-5-thioribose-1-phosphate isomerase n=1 Tax=Peribacillus simplex TaxID=1478 RepID=UPI000BA7D6F1|nr:S-methyl-5-thioribose-1-phosphate isomerase [Peribacillus simplex]PAK35566.1 S-methyl-5-thioribose-1-phosphate isomerase [Peribacillus simplex]